MVLTAAAAVVEADTDLACLVAVVAAAHFVVAAWVVYHSVP